MRRGNLYQIILIILGLTATALFSAFLWREIFPEYLIYQKDFIALEKFRAEYTGKPAAEFKTGVKQIVIEREDRGPPTIDRCISCHVALQIEDYSPTKMVDGQKVENPAYIWKKVDEAIAAGNTELKALKTATVGELTYDVTKALQMHPLIGKETRPFEFHSLDDYGCVSCHGGNGRGLVTDRAHGPIFDEQYEKEDTGFVPQFLEKDPLNDPIFSHVFNAKPGHRLLFQTNPLYVGALIQAKCMQCHKSRNEGKKEMEAEGLETGVDLLIKDYQRGEGLFLSQGCYACHRVGGFSRGGVGPELTRSGESYPWFVKESIVWPQADLKTSTMPNLRLDHEELEALLTYLLAQTGKSKAVSETDRKAALQAWELGKKLPWEKPVTSKEIQSMNYGMTVFAVEGCASCHRVHGYESNVGLKDKEDQEWFKSLFPEFILGSQIVKAIEEHQDEIDQKIQDGARKGSLLEEIESSYPGTIEALYSNFKFASRAKNHEGSLISDPWKKRVHKVLMMFIQTYGLGRMICPKLDWAGVYRSDQWLMEHFKAPTMRVPRSIMPVFPFDDTKFLALTETLDKLARANVAEEKKEPFNPETAYMTHCSQCHGDQRQGNGPVAEWLYPLPKNLRNADFMRNLGKERAINAITHGVKGTPMSPWGELGAGKSFKNDVPVFTSEEIHLLVDWLFSSLPGGTVIESEAGIPKWHYSAENVIQELKFDAFDAIPNGPSVAPGIPEKTAYYIKDKYYTQENIQAGEHFFILNCAACHGKEADGASVRAEAMTDAKPRMLINRDWISSQDDLKLLRSIKYGVPGTSMTPWGDFTSPMQRLQLVVFIRSLTKKESKE